MVFGSHGMDINQSLFVQNLSWTKPDITFDLKCMSNKMSQSPQNLLKLSTRNKKYQLLINFLIVSITVQQMKRKFYSRKNKDGNLLEQQVPLWSFQFIK